MLFEKEGFDMIQDAARAHGWCKIEMAGGKV
jgi:hypothetical protein